MDVVFVYVDYVDDEEIWIGIWDSMMDLFELSEKVREVEEFMLVSIELLELVVFMGVVKLVVD